MPAELSRSNAPGTRRGLARAVRAQLNVAARAIPRSTQVIGQSRIRGDCRNGFSPCRGIVGWQQAPCVPHHFRQRGSCWRLPPEPRWPWLRAGRVQSLRSETGKRRHRQLGRGSGLSPSATGTDGREARTRSSDRDHGTSPRRPGCRDGEARPGDHQGQTASAPHLRPRPSRTTPQVLTQVTSAQEEPETIRETQSLSRGRARLSCRPDEIAHRRPAERRGLDPPRLRPVGRGRDESIQSRRSRSGPRRRPALINRKVESLASTGRVGRQCQRNQVVHRHHRSRGHEGRGQVGHVPKAAAGPPWPQRLFPRHLPHSAAKRPRRLDLVDHEVGKPDPQRLDERTEVLARSRIWKAPEVGVEYDAQRAGPGRLLVDVDAEASIQAERHGVVRTGSPLQLKQPAQYGAPDRVDPPQFGLPEQRVETEDCR